MCMCPPMTLGKLRREKGGSIALMLWSTCLLIGGHLGACGRRPGQKIVGPSGLELRQMAQLLFR
jgi:hypothetical protein